MGVLLAALVTCLANSLLGRLHARARRLRPPPLQLLQILVTVRPLLEEDTLLKRPLIGPQVVRLPRRLQGVLQGVYTTRLTVACPLTVLIGTAVPHTIPLSPLLI